MVNWKHMFFVTLGLAVILSVSGMSLLAETERVSANPVCEDPEDVGNGGWETCDPEYSCEECLDHCKAVCELVCGGSSLNQFICDLTCFDNYLSCVSP